MGKILAVCISEKKGTPKKNVEQCRLIENFGLEGDAHAGSGRQVSLLSWEKVQAFKKSGYEVEDGAFGENLLVEGFDLKSFPVGSRFAIGQVLLEIIQIGKNCHSGCSVSKNTGKCIMPSEGVFASVLKGGIVKSGDEITFLRERRFTAAVLVASDRSFNGEREDKSGPLIKSILEKKGWLVSSYTLLNDDEDGLFNELVRLCDIQKADLIFTSGGTGLSPRDHMPEATLRAMEKNVPGIAEAIRNYSMKISPKAMFSRALSVMRKQTLIINLPGSPKAAEECLDFLLPLLDHGIEIMRGEGDA